LPVKTAIGLEKTLIAQRTIVPDFTIRSNFRRRDHCGQDIFKLIIEILLDRIDQHAVKRCSAADEQNRDPRGRRQDHAAGERPRALELASPRWRLHRRSDDDGRVQLTGSSRLYPRPRIVEITSCPSFLRMRVTKTSIVFESLSKSWS